MQAKVGREHILKCLTDTIAEPRAEMKPQVPRIVQMEIPKEFIGAVIGLVVRLSSRCRRILVLLSLSTRLTV